MIRPASEISSGELGDAWQDQVRAIIARGGEVLVTEDGRPVARILPVDAAKESSGDPKRNPALAGSVLWQSDLTTPISDPWLLDEGDGIWGPPSDPA